jgi:hypothetical protein
MGYVVHQSYQAWENAFADVYDALPGSAHVSCPNCDHDTLTLVFIGDPEERIGHAHFWCTHCGFGIHVSRIDIPAGVPMHSFETPPEELDRIIPDYVAVYPEPDDD